MRKTSKQKAKQLFDSGDITKVEMGKFSEHSLIVGKDDCLSSIQRSVVKDVEIKALLKQVLTHQIDDRTQFMKGIDVSYYYEGYSEFITEEL